MELTSRYIFKTSDFLLEADFLMEKYADRTPEYADRIIDDDNRESNLNHLIYNVMYNVIREGSNYINDIEEAEEELYLKGLYEGFRLDSYDYDHNREIEIYDNGSFRFEGDFLELLRDFIARKFKMLGIKLGWSYYYISYTKSRIAIEVYGDWRLDNPNWREKYGYEK